jgi:hypothetical protein
VGLQIGLIVTLSVDPVYIYLGIFDLLRLFFAFSFFAFSMVILTPLLFSRRPVWARDSLRLFLKRR